MQRHNLDDQSSPQLPAFVIVCGLPATGKSTLAAKLAVELGWPVFAKDHFKELLYDSVDRDDVDFTRGASTVIGQQSIALLFDIANELLRNGVSCIVEANFLPWLAPAGLAPLLAISRGRQVHCTIPDKLVLERYRERANAGERHPVHVDDGAEAELIERIERGGGKPLPLDVPLLEVDSTDGWNPNLNSIVAFSRA